MSKLHANIPAWLVHHETSLFLILSAIGVIIVLLNTRLGAYWSDDTYYYIQPARDFISGNGFHPTYIFGPVLPFVLSLIGFFKVDPLVSIRWINALFFGTNLYLLALIIRKITGSTGFSLIGTAIILLSDVVLETHGWAMSEALSIAFMLASILATLVYIESNHRIYGVLTALGAALAVLTRFAMLPLIPTICLTVLIIKNHRSLIHRLRDALLIGTTSLIPTLFYWLRNFLVSGHPVRYEQYIQTAFDKSQLIWFIYNWFSLFIPGRFLRGHELIAGLIVTLFTTLLFFVIYKAIHLRKTAPPSNLLKPGIFLLGSLIVFCLLMLYLARGLTELYIYNLRYLVPIFIIFIAMAVAISSWVWLLAGRLLRIGMVMFFALFLIYYSYRAIDFTQQTSSHGLGYSNIGWHQSETIAYLQTHPDLTDMVSTGEMGIYFWTNRKPTVLAAFPSTKILAEYLCSHNAPLFIMSQMPTEMYGFAHDDVIRELRLAQNFNDAEMYVCPDNP
jgi:uncharacterized membrane protein (GlpM family)